MNKDIHPDSSIYLCEADRPAYGGARVIDAQTFMAHHPDISLTRGFVLGLYHYAEPFTKKGDTQ